MTRVFTEDRPGKCTLMIDVTEEGITVHKLFPSVANQSDQKIFLDSEDLRLLRTAMEAKP